VKRRAAARTEFEAQRDADRAKSDAAKARLAWVGRAWALRAESSATVVSPVAATVDLVGAPAQPSALLALGDGSQATHSAHPPRRHATDAVQATSVASRCSEQ
jgi:hypothetical protein